MKVFWAWQSDHDPSVCRNFIKSALLESLKQLAADLDERPEIDHDTKGQPGMPDIVDSILQKIASSSALVADLTTVARTKQKKAVANPNVLIELGYAKRAIGVDRIVGVANAHWYKGPNDLPFDLRNRRGPITYLLPPDATPENRLKARTELTSSLRLALKPILQIRAAAEATQINRTNSDWFVQERSVAQAALMKANFSAQMELQLYPHASIQKSQAELREAARKAQVHTFGWPIGVVLDGDDRPKPHGDGIRAQIHVGKDNGFGTSFDYWALRSNGDFFLLKSLFEDKRAEDAIFFNTRLVRVAEALLFAGRLYSALGCPPDSKFTAVVTHRNFAGRTLTSTSGLRSITPAKTEANEGATEVVMTVGNVSAELVEAVKSILAPFFVLFDFKEFGDGIYEDIVRKFEKGHVT